MNAGGHIAVVAGLSGQEAEPGLLLGSALPDLAAMGRFRLLGATANASVAKGIFLHHRTDEAFHRHPWFTRRNRALIEQLQEAGVQRGPARACSHVGIELLLDGELLRHQSLTQATTTAFAAIGPRRPDLSSLVLAPHSERWLQHLDRLADHQLPTDYHDPWAVARRLQRILARRPRLALAQELVGTVAEVLAGHKPEIDATAGSLVAELTAEIAPFRPDDLH